MKKIISVLIILGLLVSVFTACSDSVTPDNGAEPPIVDDGGSGGNDVTGNIPITKYNGWLESLYVEWTPATEATINGYNVYYKAYSASDYTKIDDMLVRSYAATAGGTTIDHYRADILGLAAGTYDVKVVGTVTGAETESTGTVTSLTVDSHDRSGFAFTGTTTPGAYKEDGTLKDNAVVIYITENTKDTISLDVTGATTNPCVGLKAILDGYKKGKETKPLAVRLIGNITDLASMDGGDIVVENNNKTTGITIEGVGEDATANGWGIRIKNSSYIEIRNIGLMNCNSSEGDDIGLQQGNDHIWTHNCDLFYGDAGSDSDQAKGDGALDTKKSLYVTHSYNHFWDTGKSNLVGNKESIEEQNYLTFHHNWYDHSDSRHPRIRVASVHVYNNYYDGNSKYGVGATMGADVFVEGNYFRNCKLPMLTSLQGNDIYSGTGTYNSDYATFSGEAGGSIKAYNNYIEGATTSYWPYSGTGTAWSKGTSGSVPEGIDTTVQFDAYEVSNRGDTVPSTVVSVNGTNTYSNFDTDASVNLGVDVSDVDTPQNAKIKVEAFAGRMNGGDFDWEFDDATEDTNYDVIADLKSDLTSYRTKLIAVQNDSPSSGSGDGGSGDDSGSGDGSGDSNTPINGDVVVTFDSFTSGATINGFTITGNSSNSKGTCTINGTTYSNCLKMESSTNITFTTETTMTLTLVFGGTTSAAGKKVVVDTVECTTVLSGDNYIISKTLSAGTHTVTKKDSINLFYIALSE